MIVLKCHAMGFKVRVDSCKRKIFMLQNRREEAKSIFIFEKKKKRKKNVKATKLFQIPTVFLHSNTTIPSNVYVTLLTL